MPVVKGGVWTNIEDEILKASVSKYGLNQWARVSSLLARKTPKQCKARWSEWLDPSIKKIEWSKEEDEKLLHLAKLMPTQWRTIAPIVGRTATQCLERYQKLLDEAEARENDDLGLAGPTGGEAAAPSVDDVRRLRPGEVDPDPESKPAKPDTVDMDEDEKEMLSEARARLANTQGKKAKRKARERQLEESRRLANLQKRRELKSAGINIKITNRKAGQMDYNADIPFEKAPAPGFYDTQDEQQRNERAREMFDPRKQQLANKRKQDQQDEDGDDRKRRKNDNKNQQSSAAAAQRAGQMQKIREAERVGKRRALNLPAPQVSESELEDIVKMGMLGERASQSAGASDNDATKGLIGNYTSVVGQTPIRTPRAPQEEDRIANEIRNARARTETQSALLGGENPDILEGEGTTGYGGVAPSKQQLATPNPMATPLRQNGVNGTGADATPMRTPRDNFRLNEQTPVQSGGQTPREVKLAQEAARGSLRGKLASLPKPEQSDFELEELPEEEDEIIIHDSVGIEDAALRDKRNEEARVAAERAEFKRQSQVYQRALPRPHEVDMNALLQRSESIEDPIKRSISHEAALLIANDARKFGDATVHGTARALNSYSDDELLRARMEIALEIDNVKKSSNEDLDVAWRTVHGGGMIPGLASYDDTAEQEEQADPDSERAKLTHAFETASQSLDTLAYSTSATEKRLAKTLGGYQARAKQLRSKFNDAYAAFVKTEIELATSRHAQVAEDAAIAGRLERLRGDVEGVMKRERVAQEVYRARRGELDELSS